MADDPTTLYINMTDSRCGACGKQAYPGDGTHEHVPGAGDVLGVGCHVRWTHVSSDYMDPTGQLARGIKALRPDLIPVNI